MAGEFDQSFSVTTDFSSIVKESKSAETAINNLEKATTKVKTGLDQVESASGKSGKEMQHAARGALQLSQAFQDFAQGGFGGIINNIDGLVGSLAKAFGVSATAANTFAAASLGVGTALLVGVPLLKSFYGYITEGTGKLPESTDRVSKYNDELKNLKDRLEELKERDGTLSTKEVDEYVKGGERVLEIEKKLANAKSGEKAKLSLEAILDPVEKEYMDKRSEILKEKMGGAG